MVQVPNNEVFSVPTDSRLPERPQNAQNLATIVGLGGAGLTGLASAYAMFALASRDPGLGWIVIGTIWAVYAGAMAVLWFLTAEE